MARIAFLFFIVSLVSGCGLDFLTSTTDSASLVDEPEEVPEPSTPENPEVETDDFLVAITASPSSITIWKMDGSSTVDLSSEQTLNWGDFSNSGSYSDGFFGLAYSDNQIYISGRLERVYRLSFTLDGNQDAVLGTTFVVNGDTSATENGENTYYLNNNIFNDTLFAARINEGIQFMDLSDWTPSGVSYFDNGFDGGKSACMIGSQIFLAGDDAQGVLRMDDVTGTNITGYQAATNPGIESITTDGTYLFGNDDINRGVIHKYLPGGPGSTLTLTDQNGGTWTDPDIGGRIRGISYSDNGYLYVSPAGSGAILDRAVYSIDAETGTPQATNAEVPGGGSVFGVIRVSIPRD